MFEIDSLLLEPLVVIVRHFQSSVSFKNELKLFKNWNHFRPDILLLIHYFCRSWIHCDCFRLENICVSLNDCKIYLKTRHVDIKTIFSKIWTWNFKFTGKNIILNSWLQFWEEILKNLNFKLKFQKIFVLKFWKIGIFLTLRLNFIWMGFWFL